MTSQHPRRSITGSLVLRRVGAAALSALTGAGGCMVGPDYQRPEAEVADSWLVLGDANGDASAAETAWWESFGDPALTALVEEAIRQNLTLRQAGLRVIQARALRGIAAGRLFPQVQAATADVGQSHLSGNTPQGLGDRDFTEFGVGLEAAWELDFWGRFRRGIESEDAALEASIADFDAVLVLVASDVASTYVLIRSLEEQLAFTRSNVESQSDTAELSRIRFETGAVSELDVFTARATLTSTQSLIPQLEDDLRRAKLALSVLLGRVPSELVAELGAGAGVPIAPTQIASGVPADLLRRRPDIRRAERVAASFSARIGVATADLFPSVTILGQTGFRAADFESPTVSPSAANLFDSRSFQGFIGLDINWPILNYGRITNNIRLADARFQEAAVAYQQSVLVAASEVEAGLSRFLRAGEQASYLEASVEAARGATDLALIQYRQGAVDFIRVNQAMVDLLDRQNRLVAARAGVALGAIDAYRALGGGWEVRGVFEFVPPETILEMRRRTDWGDVLPEPAMTPQPEATNEPTE